MSQIKQVYEQTEEYNLAEALYNFDQALDGLERQLEIKPFTRLAETIKGIRDQIEQTVAQSITCRKCDTPLRDDEVNLCPNCGI